jgi:hypothetical protein
LHLTRREDLLDLHLQPPDLSLYQDPTPLGHQAKASRLRMPLIHIS